eukprot:scaffold50903_cov22-Tisochrysis_lutea.AAC.1
MEIMRCCTAKNPHHRQQQQVASDVGGSSSGVQLKSACLLLEIELGDQGSSVQLLPSRVTPLCKGERKQSVFYLNSTLLVLVAVRIVLTHHNKFCAAANQLQLSRSPW